MSKNFLIAFALVMGASGCTSFRTTMLSRFENDSVAPQETNRKLKGLPVKLKVPSHVCVTVSEQQVILANSDDAIEENEKTAKEAAVAVETQKGVIAAIESGVAREEETLAGLKNTERLLRDLLATALGDGNDEEDKEAVTALRGKLRTNIGRQADQAVNVADAKAKVTTLEQERAKLVDLESQAAIAARDAVVKYTLVSFDPPQYTVETELQYTDKIFLVDFKRPAGGVLDLKEASMDDEQYFAKVQAEVEERTLSDISTAIETLTDPLSNLAGIGGRNIAVPTSAATPDGEENETVHFQKSVVATQRFDIAEPGWEGRLQAFVSAHLGMQAAPFQPPLGVVADGTVGECYSDPVEYFEGGSTYYSASTDEGTLAPAKMSSKVLDTVPAN